MKQESIKNLSEAIHRNLDLSVYITDIEAIINILTTIIKTSQSEN